MPRPKAANKAPGKKKIPAKGVYQLAKPLANGEILKDLRKKEWRIGKPIGQGGFGLLYLAGENNGKPIMSQATHVLKIEPHSNGPLFMELAFYQRCAKQEDIQEWVSKKKMKSIGVPKFVASGQHDDGQQKCRFMVMDRFGSDLQKIFEGNGKVFSMKIVCILALRVLECLAYIHSKGYVHADIKASNLLLGLGKSENKVFLVDYGLAQTFVSRDSGKHRPYTEDPKRCHDGTIEFTSRDAHKGVAPSRRADIEILGYCLVQWLCGQLPWEKKLLDKEYVMAQKIKALKNIPAFLTECFSSKKFPDMLKSYLTYASTMEYDEEPDYKLLSKLFHTALNKIGCKDDVLDFSKATNGKNSSSDEEIPVTTKKRKQKLPPPEPTSPVGKSPRLETPRKRSPVVKSPCVKSPRVASPRVTSPRPSAATITSPGVVSRVVKSPRVRNPGKTSSSSIKFPPKNSLLPNITSPVQTSTVNSETSKASKKRGLADKTDGKKSKIRKILSTVGTQTSPGLKGLRRSRKK